MSDPEPGGSPGSSASAAGRRPRRVRGYVWPTEFLVLADFLDASRHHHSALQLMVGIDGVVGMDFGDGWVSLPGHWWIRMSPTRWMGAAACSVWGGSRARAHEAKDSDGFSAAARGHRSNRKPLRRSPQPSLLVSEKW